MSAERVAVSGGAGTVGQAVVKELLEKGYAVTVGDQREPPAWVKRECAVVEGDLREERFARRTVAGASRVIHLAAIVGGIGNFHRYPYAILQANNALTAAFVDAALKAGVARFTYVSSSMVFERATVFPTPESHLDDCPPPRSAYGFSKLAGERYCRAAREEHGLSYTICRPFNAYGPGEHPADEPGIAHLVPDLIKKSLAGQAPLSIFGDGNQTRTLTHVRDIARGIVLATFTAAAENEDFNISAQQELTVAQIAALVWEACGRDPAAFALSHRPSYPVDVRRRWPAVEKAQRLLGFSTEVELREGLAETARWLRAEAFDRPS